MILIDTSVWIPALRDKSGGSAEQLRQWLGDQEPALTRFNQLELLQGCRDEQD